MAARKHLIGRRGALAAVVARLRRKPEPEPRPDAELDDDPWDDVAEEEVVELREELRRELDRLESRSRAHPAEPGASGWGDIKASQTRHESTSPPG
jgi:hypothetical protein